MNNKKILYWMIGILAAVLIIILFWGMNGNQPEVPPNPTTNHAEMSHETPVESVPAESGSEDTEYSRYMDEKTAIMDRMMRDMELTEETGNSALDFIDGMIPHHEAAVAMAESYLKNGGAHEQLKPLAEDIITAQKEEITQMNDMRKTVADSGRKNQDSADAYRAKYEEMMEGHHGSHGSSETGDSIDAAFAEGMIMHHRMAVDMAEAILDNTDEEALLELSRQIIDTQEEEITLMQSVLRKS